MTKATHNGECQVCGRRQKLPNGRLSKHGYTKRWGFFQGVCPGAGNLPYEQSCEFLKGWVPDVALRRADLVNRIADHEGGATPLLAERRVPARRWGYHEYRWEEAELVDGRAVFKRDESQESQRVDVYPRHGETLEQALRRAWADEQRLEVRGLDDWLKWARDRIKTWKPRELEPVAA